MAQPAVEIRGLKDFRRDLKAVGTEFPKALRVAHKKIADDVAEAARGKAAAMGGVRAKAASKIKGYATPVQASVGFPAGGIAGAAFWGTKRHTGWYAARRYAGSPPQHPPWVGNSWEPGVAGQGPYAINAAIADSLEKITGAFGEAITDISKQAFPD